MTQSPELDCSKLPGPWLQSICAGTSGLPPEVAEAYRRHWSGQPPAEVPAAPDLSCIHRGAQLAGAEGWTPCPNCPTGKVKLRVLACSVHGRCVMAGPVGDIAGCVGCTDRQPPDDAAGSGRPPLAEAAPAEQAPAFNVVLNVEVVERHVSRTHPGQGGNWCERIIRKSIAPDGSVTISEPEYRLLEPHEWPKGR